MSGLTDADLHGYMDGELDSERRALVAGQLAQDPALAAKIAAFSADKARFAQAFGAAPPDVPAAWIARIEAASRPAGRKALAGHPIVMAWAAAIVLALIGAYADTTLFPQDAVLSAALDARGGATAPVLSLAGTMLPSAAARDALLQDRLHLKVHAPDLSHFGFRLARLDMYGHAAGLRYRDAAARELTIYVKASSGEARFDMLRRGDLRVCIWQDDVVSAVIAGRMSAGEMMRVASSAYAALDL
jgi:anti-sigma factor RsiW